MYKEDLNIKNKQGQTEAEFLAAYRPGDYERPSVTVDMLLFTMNRTLTKLEILLIKRKNHPYINQWAFPGGFVDIKESAYEAAKRELKEETGITNVYLEQLYTNSRPDRDPRMRIIDIAYMSLIPNELIAKAGDDAANAKWFEIDFTEERLTLSNEELGIKIVYDLKNKEFKNGVLSTIGKVPTFNYKLSTDKLAFDHADILLEGLTRLRNKVEYTDLAFNLVQNEFTLPDLKSVYEAILGKTLYKTNFRDKIQHKIEALDEKDTSITGGKKSMLYRYNPRKNM